MAYSPWVALPVAARRAGIGHGSTLPENKS